MSLLQCAPPPRLTPQALGVAPGAELRGAWTLQEDHEDPTATEPLVTRNKPQVFVPGPQRQVLSSESWTCGR